MIKSAISEFFKDIKEDSSSCFVDNVCNLPYSCTTNDSCKFYELTLQAGSYRFELWGAKGGDGFFSDVLRYGGAGGFSRGEILLLKARKVFVHVGGSGLSIKSSTKVNGGYNGGGYNSDTRNDYFKSTGGGSTDIRLDVNNLYHRIIVAGGGGGANGATSGGAANGGVGGGLSGGKSPGHYSFGGDYSGSDGNGGTQEEGGLTGIKIASEINTASQINGTFGNGGNVEGSNAMAGPGGGGWYGGAAGCSHGGAGGGGSGFVLNESTAAYAPSSYSFTDAREDFLMNCTTLKGSETFLSPDNQLVTGNNGNGYARITKLGSIKKPSTRRQLLILNNLFPFSFLMELFNKHISFFNCTIHNIVFNDCQLSISFYPYLTHLKAYTLVIPFIN